MGSWQTAGIKTNERVPAYLLEAYKGKKTTWEAFLNGGEKWWKDMDPGSAKNEEIVKQIKITGYIHLTLCY